LDTSLSEVKECVDRFEEFSGSLETENGMRLKAMVEMQNKLATWIGMGLDLFKEFLHILTNSE
jgi:hypothetical protein